MLIERIQLWEQSDYLQIFTSNSFKNLSKGIKWDKWYIIYYFEKLKFYKVIYFYKNIQMNFVRKKNSWCGLFTQTRPSHRFLYGPFVAQLGPTSGLVHRYNWLVWAAFDNYALILSIYLMVYHIIKHYTLFLGFTFCVLLYTVS